MSPPTSIPGLTSGTTFCYRFLAYNVAGDSAYSNKACGTTPQDFSLTVVRAGTGGGTVASTPAGISCGRDCSEPYPGGRIHVWRLERWLHGHGFLHGDRHGRQDGHRHVQSRCHPTCGANRTSDPIDDPRRLKKRLGRG